MSDLNDNTAYENEVRSRIQRAINEGCEALIDLLSRADGADPRLVTALYNEIKSDTEPHSVAADFSEMTAIRSRLLERLPAPDPSLAQWWYTPESQEMIARRVLSTWTDSTSPFHVLCVGAPTLAPLLKKAGCMVTVVELDPDVITSLNSSCPDVETKKCDLLTENLQLQPAHCVIVDPPWYLAEMLSFLYNAIQNLCIDGHLFVSLPPLLTRPGIQTERQELLHFIQENGTDVLFLDRNVVHYSVPHFEESAFSNLDGFCGRPWRVADLLVSKKRLDRKKSGGDSKHTTK